MTPKNLSLVFSLVSFLVGLSGLIVGSIALSQLQTEANKSNNSVSAGLTSLEDFIGVWEATGHSVVMRGPYNSTADEIETTFTSGSLTYVITNVDTEGRFEGIRCPSTISDNTASPVPLAGVIGENGMAQASIYFQNSESTPSHRFGTWRWLFTSDSRATLYLENHVNIPTQDTRSFTGTSSSVKVSTDTVCPT